MAAKSDNLRAQWSEADVSEGSDGNAKRINDMRTLAMRLADMRKAEIAGDDVARTQARDRAAVRLAWLG